DAALARAEDLAGRLEQAAAAEDWVAALERDSALAEALHDVAAALETTDTLHRGAAADVLRRVQHRHGSALRMLETARDGARVQLRDVVRGHRAAGAYLDSSEG